MELLYDRVAGPDVHCDSVAACVQLPGPRGGVVTDKQRFKTTTAGLGRLAGWLAERQVAPVAMEATGVYCKEVYYALEDRFQVWLCNAHHVKNVPGRKTDVSDAEWLADVAAHGMVRPQLCSTPPIRELRELTRHRKTQIDARVAEIQRLVKVLQDAGIKLTSVASKVLTQSGRAMVEALIAGERAPGRLAELARGELRLDARTRPYAAVFELLLLPVPGLDRYTVDVVIAETGADMGRFPSPAQLASWVGCALATMSRSANAAGSAPHPATIGGVPWSRSPAPRTPISPPSTARSPAGIAPTRPPSRSPTACLTSSGTC
jgi:transposase